MEPYWCIATIEAWRGGSLVNCKSNYACSENGNPPKNSSEKPQHCRCLKYDWIHTVNVYVNSVILICVYIGWKLEDLTKAIGGGILNQTLKGDSGYSSPNEKCTCWRYIIS